MSSSNKSQIYAQGKVLGWVDWGRHEYGEVSRAVYLKVAL